MIKQSIEDTFGNNALGHAVFYQHPHGLRFELSESGDPSYIHMFLGAYEKAAEIADFLFADAQDLHAAICFYSDSNASLVSGLSVFKSLKSCGVKIIKPYDAWVNPHREDDEDPYRISIVFKIDRQVVSQLLWGAIASEIGIRPRIIGSVYLFDLELGISIHPYDDRGMDAIGNNYELLKLAYNKFDRYLLDYDRQIMRDRFDK
jgi:hypothetical protein